ncbi:DUF2095 domain-containing protein [Thermococcus atlanticus]
MEDDKSEKKKAKVKAADDFAWQEYEREEFEERFPHLSRELEERGIPIEAYRLDEDEVIDEDIRDFSGYRPTVIDFLRRCETDDEALEIINWLEERGEITPEMARDLRITLVKKGVRAFGSKKEWGWYEKHRKRD